MLVCGGDVEGAAVGVAEGAGRRGLGRRDDPQAAAVPVEHPYASGTGQVHAARLVERHAVGAALNAALPRHDGRQRARGPGSSPGGKGYARRSRRPASATYNSRPSPATATPDGRLSPSTTTSAAPAGETRTTRPAVPVRSLAGGGSTTYSVPSGAMARSVGPFNDVSPTRSTTVATSPSSRRLTRFRSCSAAIRRREVSMANPDAPPLSSAMTSGSSPTRQRSNCPRGASVNTSAPSIQMGPSANWKLVATRSTGRHRRAGAVAQAWSARPQAGVGPGAERAACAPQRRHRHRQSARQSRSDSICVIP